MAPKAATTKKTAAAASSHGSYQDMIKIAILNLKERKGSSRQAIKKYIKSNNDLGATTDAAFNSHLNRALTTGEEQGVFERPKGPSGPVKLKKPASGEAKPAATKSAAPKKASGTAKTAATKTKKTTTAKKPKAASTATKKAAAKPKANTSKKTAAPAPAVEEKPLVVTGKTKSGRVTKSKAPQSSTKKTAPKKAATKKAAPKKSATPKKE